MKLLSLNIEGDKHLETRIFPLLITEKFDALCLQEVFAQDLAEIARVSQLADYIFAPQASITQPNPHLPPRGEWGIAIFARKLVQSQRDYYVGRQDVIPDFFANNDPNSMNRVLLSANVVADKHHFHLATTHFTWSGKGVVTPLQRANFVMMQRLLAHFDEIVLCGDFNTPRGSEIYDQLAEVYTDNLPPDVKTTIDNRIHKSGEDIQLVVDGLFTSRGLSVSNCRVLNGVSDHMAITAEINLRQA